MTGTALMTFGQSFLASVRMTALRLSQTFRNKPQHIADVGSFVQGAG